MTSEETMKEVPLEQALDLTGFGKYNYFLLGATFMSMLAMCIDLTSLSFIVPASDCDLNLTLQEKSLLSAVPALGLILMSYPWGCISDMKGRRLSLLISMTFGFIFSFLTSFAPNLEWIATLKFLSVAFSSAANSVAYTMLGEFQPEKYRDKMSFVLTSGLMCPMAVMAALAIPILSMMNFETELPGTGIIFNPWRLFNMVLSLFTLGSAILLFFTAESPKFLLIHGRHDEALKVLKKMFAVNTGKSEDEFNVLSISAGTETLATKNESFWKSLWLQFSPLFRTPLLKHTLYLSYIQFFVCFVANSYFMWLPTIAMKFLDGMSKGDAGDQTFCHAVSSSIDASPGTYNATGSTYNASSELNEGCSDTIDVTVALVSMLVSLVCFFINIISVFILQWTGKRFYTIALLAFNGLCGVLILLIENSMAGIIFFMGFLVVCLGVGPVTAYAVEIYPTYLRGMAVCMSIMVGRMGGMFGIYIIGSFFEQYCVETFGFSTALIFSCALLAIMLPADLKRKTTTETERLKA